MYFLYFLYSLIFAVSAQPSMSTAPRVSEKLHWSVPMQTSEEWVRHSNIYADVHAEPEDDGVALYLARYSATAIPKIAKQMGIPVGGPMQI
jgi:hypothetical protein